MKNMRFFFDNLLNKRIEFKIENFSTEKKWKFVYQKTITLTEGKKYNYEIERLDDNEFKMHIFQQRKHGKKKYELAMVVQIEESSEDLIFANVDKGFLARRTLEKLLKTQVDENKNYLIRSCFIDYLNGNQFLETMAAYRKIEIEISVPNAKK